MDKKIRKRNSLKFNKIKFKSIFSTIIFRTTSKRFFENKGKKIIVIFGIIRK